jgi:hypothetical protein
MRLRTTPSSSRRRSNTAKQFADYFFSGAPGRPTIILALARAFHELAAEADVA